jgi:hypothetical protein
MLFTDPTVVAVAARHQRGVYRSAAGLRLFVVIVLAAPKIQVRQQGDEDQCGDQPDED